jgi:hypothetical protein
MVSNEMRDVLTKAIRLGQAHPDAEVDSVFKIGCRDKLKKNLMWYESAESSEVLARYMSIGRAAVIMDAGSIKGRPFLTNCKLQSTYAAVKAGSFAKCKCE